MSNFKDCGVSDKVLTLLNQVNYHQPTDIQKKSISVILDNHDILASSKTGSGKTAAFIIPMLEKIFANQNNFCLVIAPTRELVTQIYDTAKLIAQNNIKSCAIYGGVDINKQINNLKKNPNLIIATPGRIKDHIKRKTIKIRQINHFILDEFDRMLDMGFKEEIKEIYEQISDEKQVIMFSATKTPEITKLAESFLDKNYKTVEVITNEENNKNIKHDFISVTKDNKYELLKTELEHREGSIIIFVNTKRTADKLQKQLNNEGYKANSIHGDLRQHQRDRIIKKFRSKNYQILVATDVVARGIDIDHIEHVINFDLPRATEDYVHRVGRTGRMEATGYAISFILNSDQNIYFKIIKLLNIEDVLLLTHSVKAKKSRKKKANNNNKNITKDSRTKKNSRRKSTFNDNKTKSKISRPNKKQATRSHSGEIKEDKRPGSSKSNNKKSHSNSNKSNKTNNRGFKTKRSDSARKNHPKNKVKN